MRSKLHRLLIIACALSIFSFLFVPSAKAEPVSGDYQIYTPPSGPLTSCNGNGFTFLISASVNLSYLSFYTVNTTLNGVSIPGRSGTQSIANHITIPLTPVNQTSFTTAFPAGQTGTYTLVSHVVAVYIAGPNNGQAVYDETWTIICNTVTGTGTYNIYSVPFESACLFTDGRLNCHDAGQTVAVYCADDGTVTGLAIYKGVGYPGIVATPDEIAAVPTHPAKNTLIKQGNGVRLYRLTGGKLQAVRAEDGTGKNYSFTFSCDPAK